MSLKVLVTGSSGYVGSHSVKCFARAGLAVYGLDEVLPHREVEAYLSDNLHAEIAESLLVEDFCRKNGIQAVVHCAAKCLVEESVSFPDLYRKVNTLDAGRFADALERAGVRNFLFSSTAAVYGEPVKIPIPEDHQRVPVNPYGDTKREFEDDLLTRAKAGRMNVGIFRYFNVGGADPETEIGERHEPETHMIPNALRAGLTNSGVFRLFGTDYPTRDGTCERDYIHVWDLAEAHLLLLDRLCRTGEGGIFNLGTGKGWTNKEVLDESDRQLGVKMKRLMMGRRPGDPAVLVADPSKANRELGWSAKHSGLEEIVQTALAWERKRLAARQREANGRL